MQKWKKIGKTTPKYFSIMWTVVKQIAFLEGNYLVVVDTEKYLTNLFSTYKKYNFIQQEKEWNTILGNTHRHNDDTLQKQQPIAI